MHALNEVGIFASIPSLLRIFKKSEMVIEFCQMLFLCLLR